MMEAVKLRTHHKKAPRSHLPFKVGMAKKIPSGDSEESQLWNTGRKMEDSDDRYLDEEALEKSIHPILAHIGCGIEVFLAVMNRMNIP